MSLTIHPDLQSLIPPLSPEEHLQLETNILKDGCRDPLIVWQETQILLDGHHRFSICERHELRYTIQELTLPDMDAAKAWMIANQLGRRNLTPDQMAYYRGEQYNLQKRQGKRTDLTSRHNGEKFTSPAATLAAIHKVGERTIERDGAYASAVETLAIVLGPETRQAILAGDLQLTKQDVPLLASLVEQSPETATQIKAALHGVAPVDELRAILTAARCTICHRPLSDPVSVSRGIGPICAGHGNGAHGSQGGGGVVPHRSESVLVLEPEDPEADGESWYEKVFTGDYEWHTPDEILTPLRQVLGEIDLDPASCDTAQTRVQARTYYTLADDGLSHPWHGKVFLNPPYKLPDVARFIGKLFEEIDAEHTTEAIVIVNSATSTDWFQAAFERAGAVCFPHGKIKFLHATKNGLHPCAPQTILYFGPHVERFCVVFAALGVSTGVRTTDAQQAQLALAKAPTFPDDPAGLLLGRDGRPMRARDYCVVHLKQRHAEFDHCSVQACSQAPHYLFWAQIPRQDGDPTWTRYYELCPTHAAVWCTAHQVDIKAIPTISSAAWDKVYRASPSAYDQLPWFRLSAHSAPTCPPFDTAKFVLGKLCKAGHAWGATGQTRLRINGRYCPDCNAATKRQQRKERKQAVGAGA